MDRAMPPIGLSSLPLPNALDCARIPRLPATAYYIPDFISEDEETLLLDKVCPHAHPRVPT